MFYHYVPSSFFIYLYFICILYLNIYNYFVIINTIYVLQLFIWLLWLLIFVIMWMLWHGCVCEVTGFMGCAGGEGACPITSSPPPLYPCLILSEDVSVFIATVIINIAWPSSHPNSPQYAPRISSCRHRKEICYCTNADTLSVIKGPVLLFSTDWNCPCAVC